MSYVIPDECNFAKCFSDECHLAKCYSSECHSDVKTSDNWHLSSVSLLVSLYLGSNENELPYFGLSQVEASLGNNKADSKN